MRNIALKLMYNGTAYHGWQMQRTEASVQETLQRGLSMVCGERVRLTGVGRTDAGVHALGLCAHFDSATRIPPEKLAFALNTMLPPDVRIRESGPAPEGFHARYSACGKVYRYAFFNSRHDCAIGRQYAAHVPLELDERLMHEEAQALCGTHDYTSFCANRHMKKSAVRTVERIEIERMGDEVQLAFSGDGFLYHMVRILTGTLLEVGFGERSAAEMADILAAKDRAAAGKTAPAQGLILWETRY